MNQKLQEARRAAFGRNVIFVSDGRPKALIAHTVKGKGISFVENQVGWHNHVPNDEQYQAGFEVIGRERGSI